MKAPLVLFIAALLLLPSQAKAMKMAPAKDPDTSGVVVLTESGNLRSGIRGLEAERLAPGLAVIDTKPGGEAAVLRQLRSRPGVLAANRLVLMKPHGFSRDPLGWRNWSFQNTRPRYPALGPYVGKSEKADAKEIGAPLFLKASRDADIDLPEAWQITTGSRSTIVAVLDTGFDYIHKELRDQVWTNPGEIAGNGIDDDKNGYVDDIHGLNTIGGPGESDPIDRDFHGTHVAGTIGARTDNGIGVPGINKEISLMSIRALSSAGGSDAALAAGMIYAAENGARIINGSFGGYGKSPVMARVIRDNPQVLFVFSAGNEGGNNDKKATWPCNVKAANVICVGSSGPSDKLSQFSNYGPRHIEIAAPGEAILSSVPFFLGCEGVKGKPCYGEFAFDSAVPFGEWTHGGEGDLWGPGYKKFNVMGNKLEGKTIEDSRGVDYLPNSSSWAEPPLKTFNTAGSSCLLSVTTSGWTENGEDRMRIKLSTDNGSSYQKLLSITGDQQTDLLFFVLPFRSYSAWVDIPVGARAGLRYELVSDGDIQGKGLSILESKIYCPGPLANVNSFSGTSMASPHVAGVAALALAIRPGASPAQLKAAILRGADRDRLLKGKVAGNRRLNAVGALREIRRIVSPPK